MITKKYLNTIINMDYDLKLMKIMINMEYLKVIRTSEDNDNQD